MSSLLWGRAGGPPRAQGTTGGQLCRHRYRGSGGSPGPGEDGGQLLSGVWGRGAGPLPKPRVVRRTRPHETTARPEGAGPTRQRPGLQSVTFPPGREPERPRPAPRRCPRSASPAVRGSRVQCPPLGPRPTRRSRRRRQGPPPRPYDTATIEAALARTLPARASAGREPPARGRVWRRNGRPPSPIVSGPAPVPHLTGPNRRRER